MTELTKYTTERGITPETLEHFGLRQDGNRVAIPYPTGTKYRQGWEPGERKFYWSEGATNGLFNGQEADRPVVFLTEGESDCMRLWQEIPRHDRVGVVAVSGANGLVSAAAERLRGRQVFAVFDNDADYHTASSIDDAIVRLRNIVPGAKRIRLPDGVKDVCEFFREYDFSTFELLVSNASKSRFKPVDLSATPPATQWLVEKLIANGDTHLVIGEPGVGKSWLTLDLAVAVAEGRESYLGHRMHGGAGRVLYVDEENPLDVVLRRLRLFGLTEHGMGNVRFLHHPGIRLDKDPGELLGEAKEFAPRLIVLDSLTRLHTQDENSANEVSKLFNDGILPLARETGAAVVIIHHANKSESNSSFRRTRGSGDMTGAPDTAFDIRIADQDAVNVIIAKSRRVGSGHVALIKRLITDTSAAHVLQETPF